MVTTWCFRCTLSVRGCVFYELFEQTECFYSSLVQVFLYHFLQPNSSRPFYPDVFWCRSSHITLSCTITPTHTFKKWWKVCVRGSSLQQNTFSSQSVKNVLVWLCNRLCLNISTGVCGTFLYCDWTNHLHSDRLWGEHVNKGGMSHCSGNEFFGGMSQSDCDLNYRTVLWKWEKSRWLQLNWFHFTSHPSSKSTANWFSAICIIPETNEQTNNQREQNITSLLAVHGADLVYIYNKQICINWCMGNVKIRFYSSAEQKTPATWRTFGGRNRLKPTHPQGFNRSLAAESFHDDQLASPWNLVCVTCTTCGDGAACGSAYKETLRSDSVRICP